MSVKVMSAVFDRYAVGGGEMLLALALADVARDDGVLMLNDSVSELARKTRQTTRGVQIQLRRMQAAGWLLLVRASDGGRGRSSTYRISKRWIDGDDLQPVGTSRPNVPDETMNAATRNPERGSGFAKTETLNAATRNPERGSGVIKTIDTKEINTPQPPKGAESFFQDDAEPTGQGPLSIGTWLQRCREQGEQPIPADDPVFAYCATVGIGRDLLALHWREFKARRSESRKRQRDWRATFRNSVRDNWYRLWFLKPGFEAQLTTQGLQADAVMRAEQARTAACVEHEAVPA